MYDAIAKKNLKLASISITSTLIDRKVLDSVLRERTGSLSAAFVCRALQCQAMPCIMLPSHID